MITCTWIVADQGLCDKSATDYDNFMLCEEHQQALRVRKTSRLAGLVRQSLQYHPLSSFPGYCYFVQLPDGVIKIGYSNTIELVDNRMRSLSKQYGAEVKLLATMPGGFAAEALMHDTFKVERLPGRGERFRPSSELMKFVAGLTVNMPLNTTSPFLDLIGEAGYIFDHVDGQPLPAGALLFDHCSKPPKPTPPWRVPSWRDGKTPLPVDVIALTTRGSGKSAVTDVARYMRHYAASPPGKTRREVIRALMEGGHYQNDKVIRDAWRALGQIGRVLDENGEMNTTAECFWEFRPSEFKEVSA